MKTIRQIEVTPVYVEIMPPYGTFDEGKIYISKKYSVAVHRCLCGCGEKTVLPLHPVHGWVLTEHGDKVSFTPSVGNYQFPCKSHYIITRNKANFV